MAPPVRASASFLAMLGVLWCAPARATPFEVQTVDSAGVDRGVHSSLALDSRGIPHISYYGDNQILYASKHDTTWTIETVDTDVGYYTSLAFDANDVPHVCYFDSTNADVRYATKEPGYWVNELVDSAGSVGQYASLALDPNGRPGIAYFDNTNGNLKYATKSNGAWSIEVPDSAGVVGFYSSIAYDAAGEACVSYLNLEGGLKFARRTPAGWVTVSVDIGRNLGSFCSLALDTLGFGHISYADLDLKSLKYARETAAGWFLETVDPSNGAGTYTSIQLTKGMEPRISNIAVLFHRLTYAAHESSGWAFDEVDPATSVSHFTSLKLDSNGNPMISYYDEVRKNLKFADASIHLIEPHGGELWGAGSTQNIVWDGVGPVDVYISQDDGSTYTKVTSAPSPYHTVSVTVPMWSTQTARVKIVRDSPLASSATQATLTIAPGLAPPWWTKLVDSAGLTGFSPSLKVTSSESPRVSYWDTSAGAVRYAYRSGGVWSSETVRAGIGAHTECPLALSSTGIPSIAYFDNVAWTLNWAVRLNGVWSSEIVRSFTTINEHCSLALNRFGTPRISYHETSPSRLVLMARFGTSWLGEDVDTGPGVGLWNSLALDSAGEPSISYYDANAGDLKFASKAGPSWTLETIDTGGDVGANNSLALDAQGNPHISYLDTSSGSLKYATKSFGVWRIETVDNRGRVGGATSIALDASGAPRIAYQDRRARQLLYATRTDAGWIVETVLPATSAGSASSLALGRDGTARIAYTDDQVSDLRYASSAIELHELGSPTWPIGAHRTVAWDGVGFPSLFLSRDGGATFNLVAASIPGGSYNLQMSGPASTQCLLRIERSLPYSVSQSDTFAADASVDVLYFRADPVPFGSGADVSWRTEPTVPDLSGYRLERAPSGSAYVTLLPLTTDTSYHDAGAAPGTKYRLTAINGAGGEVALGEVEFRPRKPLAAGPLPYRGGSLAISFAAAGGPGQAHAELRLYDIRGRLVRTVARGDYPVGFQSVEWTGLDDRGHKVPSGMYVLKSTSGGHEASMKIMIVR